MAWYPKAIRKEITKHRTSISGPNRIINHIAVSNSDSLYGYFNSPSVGVCSHFYVRFDGTVEQYVDTKYRAPANLEANPDSISIETAGGVTNANTEPWTSAQVKSLIELNRWICDTHNIPKTLLPDSKAGRRGIGYHRLGVDPWRCSGCQKWSNAYGKICPGQGKINQMPGIVKAVAEGEEVSKEDVRIGVMEILKEAFDAATLPLAERTSTGMAARKYLRTILLGVDNIVPYVVWKTDDIVAAPGSAASSDTNTHWQAASHLTSQTEYVRYQIPQRLDELEAKLDAALAVAAGEDLQTILDRIDQRADEAAVERQELEDALVGTTTKLLSIEDLLVNFEAGDIDEAALARELVNLVKQIPDPEPEGN